jgi:RNA polymerase sigma-70 factor, ECF subfamily
MSEGLELRLADLHKLRALDQLASEAVAAYGPEIYGFLKNVLGEADAAAEVYSQTIEDLWRGLAAFHGRCSMRSWIYVLAHSAAARYRRSPWNRQRTGDERLERLVAEAHTRTAPWLRTEVKDKWRALRDALDPDDRALLVLRIDRDLDWTEITRILIDDPAPSELALTRASARFRKRFQVLKDELRERGRAAGLLKDPDGER